LGEGKTGKGRAKKEREDVLTEIFKHNGLFFVNQSKEKRVEDLLSKGQKKTDWPREAVRHRRIL